MTKKGSKKDRGKKALKKASEKRLSDKALHRNALEVCGKRRLDKLAGSWISAPRKVFEE